MKKIIMPVFIVIAVAAAAMIIFQQPSRYPASMKSADGVITISSSIDDDESIKEIKRYILGALDWNYLSGKNLLVLKMGELKIKTDRGQDDFCILYPNITTVFEAPEITYSGEHPQVTVYSACDPSQLEFDFGFLSNAETLRKAKLDSVQSGSAIRFGNWEDETPKVWRIKQIKFSNNNLDKSTPLDLTKYEILALLGRPVEFKLNN